MATKTIIIDDEDNARENLKLIIEDYCPELEIVAEAGSAKEARKLIEVHEPQLLLLDINMPNEDGFELLNSISNKNFSVIFITAHNQFALKALKAGAIDYLEKPIDIEELQLAVSKITNSDISAGNVDYKMIKSLLNEYKFNNKSDIIAVPTLSGYEIIKIEDIVYFEADESYTRMFLSNGHKLISSMTIARYEKVLDNTIFYRIHKSYIINTRHHLKEFNRHDGNVAIMDSGVSIPVSRRKLTGFINAIKTF
ncbi:MAG: DNA-binding response regulator [Flavobacteriales bacterium CG_4_10_14_0_2_um_filter_32_8]|nr:MAG: DNA-binding response regulator [Flavobacteriales bacterium CG_4_10_14_0_2_um_filter_32_8]PJB13993.1 MAG: DNA-binding response regulator [Flavobacteriales bacterium CG_4_9_14_3_um_filter_32_8]